MAKSSSKEAAREAKRTKLPVHLRHELLVEAGYKCGNPRCQHVITFEIHHIQYVSRGGGDEASNLLVLCPNCHTLHHAGHISLEAIRLWKGLLVAINQAFDRKGLELLLLLRSTPRNALWFSSDGLLHFAGLIGAGLVEIRSTETTFMAPNESRKFTQSTHNLQLTPRGKLLLDAWLSGDERGYRELVSESSRSNNQDAPN